MFYWICYYTECMRILGIDPGLAIVGYSILDVDGDLYELVTSGSIQTAKGHSDASRLFEISGDLESIIKKYKPDEAAVEKLFFFRNHTTIIPVAEARGIILMLLEKYNVKISEYTPIVVKQTMTGYGRATKDEVAQAVSHIIDGKLPKLDDTIDSIALAICHARNVECMKAAMA